MSEIITQPIGEKLAASLLRDAAVPTSTGPAFVRHLELQHDTKSYRLILSNGLVLTGPLATGIERVIRFPS